MTPAPTLHLVADGIAFDAGETTILRDVNLEADVRSLGVIGANGSGKTTFARIVAGLAAPTAGSLRVGGIDAVADPKALRRAGGLLFSNPDVQVIMPTVAEDIAFTLTGRRVPKPEIPGRVERVLDLVGLTPLRDAATHTLSGGQKQLLAAAAVLVAEPAFLVADEPTAYLDGANARRLSALLLGDRTPPLLLVTHDLALAARCDLVARFRDGELVSVGPPSAQIAAYERELEAATGA